VRAGLSAWGSRTVRAAPVARGPSEDQVWTIRYSSCATGGSTFFRMKDRLGGQRGGASEWEPIKILLKNLSYAPKSLPKNLADTCQDHVVTTDLLTLGTS
jgi:hypothetical protein